MRAGFVVLGGALAACGVDTPPDAVDTDTAVDTAPVVDTDRPRDSDTDLPEAMTLEVGTGLFAGSADCGAFVPVPVSGGAVAMVNGPQGGWHLDTSVRVTGAPGELVTLTIAVTDVETGLVVTEEDPLIRNVALVADPPGRFAGSGCYLGIQAVFDFGVLGGSGAQPWRALADRVLRVAVTARALGVDGLADATASDTRTLTILADPCNLDLANPGCPCDPDNVVRPPSCEP